MTKTRVSLHKKSVIGKDISMDSIPVTPVSAIPEGSNSLKLECVTDIAAVTGAKVEQSADSQSHINVFSSLGGAGISFDDGRCGTEGHLSSVQGSVANVSAVNGGTVGSTVVRFSDEIIDRRLPLAPVKGDGTECELMRDGAAMPLVTVANHMVGSMASLTQMPHMTGQIVPRDNVTEHGSVIQFCVFSTELANCAAESVRIGRYDNIIDFHQDYCTVPLLQNQRNASCFHAADQSQVNCYSECRPSHFRSLPTAVQMPEMGCVQNDVEQWVRQQNAARQKQEQMAAFYASQVYQSSDQLPETGHYQPWPAHHRTASSLDPSTAHTSSSVDYIGLTGYGKVGAAMNVHHFRDDNYKIPDEHLTVEQRQQRQTKMEWLMAVQHMLTDDQQVPVTDESVNHMQGARFHQSRLPFPSGISWNTVPCADDMSAGPCNSKNHMVNTNYGSSVVRRDCYVPSWDAVPTAQHSWYRMQHDHCVNNTGVQTNFNHCQSADFRDRRYFGPHASSRSPAEFCQQSVRDRVMPAHAICDCTRLHAVCDPQACTCQGGMPSHMGQYYTHPSVMYGCTNVGMQLNSGCQQQISRCNEFVNGSYIMPVGGSRQLSNRMPSNCQADIKSWNSSVDAMKQRLIAAPALVQGQEVVLSPQQSSYYSTDGRNVTQPMNTPISYAPAQMPTAAVRQKQPTGKKRKSSSILTAYQLSDSKSKKLDSVADGWPCAVPASRGRMLTNITSTSLAHLAKGVENMSAVMQQTVQKGGPFQSVRGQDGHADGFDENANFLSTGDSLQSGVKNPVEQPVVPACAHTSVTSHVNTLQTSGTCSLATVSALMENSDVSTTGVDVVVTSKMPYTISYRPSDILSEGVSQGNVDTSAVSRMIPVVCGVSEAYSVSSGLISVPSGEGFSQHSRQRQCGISYHSRLADAARVDQQAATACMPLPKSLASSVAVVQPQMMSGTRLFIADHCPELTPVFDNFVLPNSIPTGTFRLPQSSHSLTSDPNYQGFAVHSVSVSVSGADVPVFHSSSIAVKPNTVQVLTTICSSDAAKLLSDSVSAGSLLSRCPQTNTSFWHQPSIPVGSRSFSTAHDAMYAVQMQNALSPSGVVTTHA